MENVNAEDMTQTYNVASSYACKGRDAPQPVQAVKQVLNIADTCVKQGRSSIEEMEFGIVAVGLEIDHMAQIYTE